MNVKQELLTGARLLVKPFGESDWMNLKLIRADPGFRRYMMPVKAPLAPTDEHYQRRAAELASAAARGPWGPRLIYLKCSGEIIGSCGIIDTNGLPLPELSFIILEKYRKQGYCVEAVHLLLASLGQLRYGAFVDPRNSESLKIIKGLGLTQIDSLCHPMLGSFGFWYEQITN